MRTNLIKARGIHTPIHGLGVELTLQGVLFTRLCSKRVFETRVSPVHWPDGFVTLMSLNKGDTAVHGCHCPCEMAVRMREVLATPWVGVCVPLAVNLSYRSLWHTPWYERVFLGVVLWCACVLSRVRSFLIFCIKSFGDCNHPQHWPRNYHFNASWRMLKWRVRWPVSHAHILGLDALHTARSLKLQKLSDTLGKTTTITTTTTTVLYSWYKNP